MQAASLLGALLGPAIGGVLADTIGIRAPFTFTGTAAALAALYGLFRLSETQHKTTRQGILEAQQGAPLRNNAVPVVLTSSSTKLQLPEKALIASSAGQQSLQIAQADDARCGSHANVSSTSRPVLPYVAKSAVPRTFAGAPCSKNR